jgi:hypothetical protein
MLFLWVSLRVPLRVSLWVPLWVPLCVPVGVQGTHLLGWDATTNPIPRD